MSWLSDRTGIHIGLGPKKVHFAPPPEIANNPAALAEWEKTQGQLNQTIGQAGTINKGALALAGGLAGAGVLGYGPMASGAGSAAGAAGGGAPLSLASLLGGVKQGAGAIGDFLGNHQG